MLIIVSAVQTIIVTLFVELDVDLANIIYLKKTAYAARKIEGYRWERLIKNYISYVIL